MSAKLDDNKLLFVTGTRADYGKLEPLALAAVEAGYQVTFFVTGMHMMAQYGLTKMEVHRRSEFRVVEYTNQRHGDPQDAVFAKTLTGFSDFIQEHKPDLVIIHGDRIESLACSLVCSTNYIRCAHVEGGEVSGTIDEQFRHCNTKLSSVHLVSSEEARGRVIRMGESPDAVHVIGSPELDIHARPTDLTIDQVLDRYEILSRDYGICIFHSVTSELDTIDVQAASLFQALVDSNRYYVVILPNNDPGSDAIKKVIDELPTERFRVLPSMRFSYFSLLMRSASAIIGNSSMGVREAPFLGVPSLDIGTRQSNRGMASSLKQCKAQDRTSIDRFIANDWGCRYPCSKSFGSGNAAQHFVKLLDSGVFWSSPMQKYFAA
ncbi:MAG: UDP-N-acetylglucosamine 2-epimerase [Granulosicoccus sp.]